MSECEKPSNKAESSEEEGQIMDEDDEEEVQPENQTRSYK